MPWVLMYSEKFEIRSYAVRREIQIKKMKSKKYIEKLVSTYNLSIPNAFGKEEGSIMLRSTIHYLSFETQLIFNHSLLFKSFPILKMACFFSMISLFFN